MTVDQDLLNEARELGLSISSISSISSIAEAALRVALHRERALRWQKENAAAIAQRERWIEEQGTPLADVQVTRI